MRLGLKLGLGSVKYSASLYSAETQAVIDEANSKGYVLPSDATLVLLDTMIASLIDDGIWAKIDVLYILATDGDRDFAKINIKNPGTYDCTEVGSPVFNVKKGFDGGGSIADGLNTNWSMRNNGVNYQQSSASIFVWAFEAPTNRGQFENAFGVNGAGVSTVSIIQLRNSANTASAAFINTSSSSIATEGAVSGLYHGDIDGVNQKLFINGVQKDSDSVTTSLPPASNSGICQVWQESVSGWRNPYIGNISIAGAGGSLFNNSADLYNVFNTYMTNINA